MKRDLAQRLLTNDDREQIHAAVQAAEQTTSGEIVCMVQSASYHYPMANVLGAVAMALPAALVLTPAIGGLLWLGHHNMWLFLGMFTLLAVPSYLLVQRTAAIKRRFISSAEMDEEVYEAAVKAFFNNRLYQTKAANGVLLFISVFERKVWVLADQGVDEKVAQHEWEAIVAGVADGIKNHRAAPAICAAVQKIGKLLAAHFPANSHNVNELEDLIVSEK